MDGRDSCCACAMLCCAVLCYFCLFFRLLGLAWLAGLGRVGKGREVGEGREEKGRREGGKGRREGKGREGKREEKGGEGDAKKGERMWKGCGG